MTQTLPQPSSHFTLDEFIQSSTAHKLGIDNHPSPAVLNNLMTLAQTMEQVRTLLGNVPVMISSGYRCSALNKAVGGALHSAHLTGLACDFTAPHVGTPYAVCLKLAGSTLPFDQLILEHSKTTTWVHLGIAASGQPPRRQVLTVDHHGTRAGLWNG